MVLTDRKEHHAGCIIQFNAGSFTSLMPACPLIGMVRHLLKPACISSVFPCFVMPIPMLYLWLSLAAPAGPPFFVVGIRAQYFTQSFGKYMIEKIGIWQYFQNIFYLIREIPARRHTDTPVLFILFSVNPGNRHLRNLYQDVQKFPDYIP
ncbi:MAG: hypothetical protein PHP59_02880 [Methanofollis sp.]|uniref:hypothetical protein n=1 Tax=Methanofollis sp. TaxID=2052835 RepID=UPI0026083E95|nr:hypothetical protein [Methanofollis sp.]MDD4254300.1 hypothetical protein [Methanofollis sp.]